MNSENIIKEASKILKKNHICSYSLDAELILADIIGVKRENLITNFNFNISDKNKKKYNFAIRRRANGEPLAYIIGKKEFWSEDFFVNCSTLVPRPETELLIYKTKNYFKNKSINILDVGTGSGCILLSILKELPLSRGTGIDISPKAIQTAKNNSKKLKLFHRSKFKLIDIDAEPQYCENEWCIVNDPNNEEKNVYLELMLLFFFAKLLQDINVDNQILQPFFSQLFNKVINFIRSDQEDLPVSRIEDVDVDALELTVSENSKYIQKKMSKKHQEK